MCGGLWRGELAADGCIRPQPSSNPRLSCATRSPCLRSTGQWQGGAAAETAMATGLRACRPGPGVRALPTESAVCRRSAGGGGPDGAGRGGRQNGDVPRSGPFDDGGRTGGECSMPVRELKNTSGRVCPLALPPSRLLLSCCRHRRLPPLTAVDADAALPFVSLLLPLLREVVGWQRQLGRQTDSVDFWPRFLPTSPRSLIHRHFPRAPGVCAQI